MPIRSTMLLLAVAICVATTATAGMAQAEPLSPKQAAMHAVESYFQPGHRRLLTEARKLEDRMRELCAAPEPRRLGNARDQFGALVTAWSRIELVRFGPALRDNRIERILFWPDRRGIGLRQVQAVLAAEDERATNPKTLHAKSVAAQGLIALEYALFGTGSDKLTGHANSFRCRYALAIAGNIAGVAGELHARWTATNGIAAQLVNPSATNTVYRTDQEVMSQIIGVLAHGLEAIRDTRIKPMLGSSASDARPRAALFWRSGKTIASVRANFIGLRTLFEQARIADTLPPASAAVANAIQFEFRNVDRSLSALTLPIDRAVIDSNQRGKLEYLVILSQSLQKLIGQDVSVALGLSVGFSSADGD